MRHTTVVTLLLALSACSGAAHTAPAPQIAKQPTLLEELTELVNGFIALQTRDANLQQQFDENTGRRAIIGQTLQQVAQDCLSAQRTPGMWRRAAQTPECETRIKAVLHDAREFYDNAIMIGDEVITNYMRVVRQLGAISRCVRSGYARIAATHTEDAAVDSAVRQQLERVTTTIFTAADGVEWSVQLVLIEILARKLSEDNLRWTERRDEIEEKRDRELDYLERLLLPDP